LKLCPFCKNEHLDDAEFCPQTGQLLKPSSRNSIYCVNCGGSVPSDAKFCPICGEPNGFAAGKRKSFIKNLKNIKLKYIKMIGVGIFLILLLFALIKLTEGLTMDGVSELTKQQ